MSIIRETIKVYDKAGFKAFRKFQINEQELLGMLEVVDDLNSVNLEEISTKYLQ